MFFGEFKFGFSIVFFWYLGYGVFLYCLICRCIWAGNGSVDNFGDLGYGLGSIVCFAYK